MAQKYNGSAWVDCADRVLKTATDTATIYPATLRTAQAGALTNYRLYGTSEGAGVETENLLLMSDLLNAPAGQAPWASQEAGHLLVLALKPNTTYTCFSNGTGSTSGSASNNRAINVDFGVNKAVFINHPASYTTGDDGKLYIGFYSDRQNAQQYLNGTAWAWLYEGAFNTQQTYIPYGYQLPLTNTSGENTDTYPLYIGSSKLGAEEYIDFAEQKVYKRTANIYDDAKTQWVNDVLDNNGQSTGGSISSHYTDNFTKVLPNQSYYHNNNFEGTRRYYFYDQNGLWISRTNQIPEWQKYFTTPANCTYIRVQVPIQGASTNWCITADASSSYIPYLQPTDPPVPLPTLTISAGDNDVSFSTTVLPAEFDATFEGWHDVTEKVWDGTEWTEVTDE